MATPIQSSGTLSVANVATYWNSGSTPSPASLYNYWDADWDLTSTNIGVDLRVSRMYGKSREKLRFHSVYQDGTHYTTGNTITVPAPSNHPEFGSYRAPLIALISMAVEVVSSSIYPTRVQVTNLPTAYQEDVSSQTYVNHAEGNGPVGVLTKIVYIPARALSLDPWDIELSVVATNTHVKGLTVHFIIPNIKNFTDITTDQVNDINLIYNLYAGALYDPYASESYDSSAQVKLWSAYSSGIVNVSDDSSRSTVIRSTNKLQTALGVVDTGENPGSLSMQVLDDYGVACVAGSRIVDPTAYPFPYA